MPAVQLSEHLWKTRLHIVGEYAREEAVYEITMVQRLGGRYGKHMLRCCSSTPSIVVAYMLQHAARLKSADECSQHVNVLHCKPWRCAASLQHFTSQPEVLAVVPVCVAEAPPAAVAPADGFWFTESLIADDNDWKTAHITY